MKAILVKTEREFKQLVSNSLTNTMKKFNTSDVKSINGIEIKTYLEVSNKYVHHYIGCGQSEFFKAPFNVVLK